MGYHRGNYRYESISVEKNVTRFYLYYFHTSLRGENIWEWATGGLVGLVVLVGLSQGGGLRQERFWARQRPREAHDGARQPRGRNHILSIENFSEK